MDRENRNFRSSTEMWRPWIFAGYALVLTTAFFSVGAGAVEIPPAVEKKVVILNQRYQDAGRIFTLKCGQCHSAPDPAALNQTKNDCTKGFAKGDLVTVRNYMADVRSGKSLYESHCARCHPLIDPGLHTADYWSRNLCTSDECFVKKLHDDEEQQLLLYLSSHSKKN